MSAQLLNLWDEWLLVLLDFFFCFICGCSVKIACLCSFDVIFGFAVMAIADLIALLSGILSV